MVVITRHAPPILPTLKKESTIQGSQSLRGYLIILHTKVEQNNLIGNSISNN